MSVHTIKFNLPEEERLLRLALDSGKLYDVIFEFLEWLRARAKHYELGVAESKELNLIRTELHSIMVQDGVDLDDY